MPNESQVFCPPGVSAHDSGKRARDIARRLANGEALPGHVLASFEKRDGKFIILASGFISASGSPDLKPVETGIGTCFIVGTEDCMIGQMTLHPHPITRADEAVVLGPFSVKPDPQGLDA